MLSVYDRIDPGQGGASQVIPTLDTTGSSRPVRFDCPQCDRSFESRDDWFRHRFYEHPYHRPVLLLDDIELTSPTHRIVRRLQPEAIRLVHTRECRLNGRVVTPEELKRVLAGASSTFVSIELVGDAKMVTASYEILVEIPDPRSIQAVEHEFSRVTDEGEMSVKSIDRFIEACRKTKNARTYVNGLANYMYGLLGKDQRGGTHLSRTEADAKLSEAYQDLDGYGTALADVLRGLINFHFNAFGVTQRLVRAPRLDHAFKWYEALMAAQEAPPAALGGFDEGTLKVPLDLATSELLDWVQAARVPSAELLAVAERRAASTDWMPGDRLKAWVMAAWLARALAMPHRALAAARRFRNDSVFGAFAEQVVSECAGQSMRTRQ